MNQDNKQIFCNYCGESCNFPDGSFPYKNEGLINAKVTGGYDSTPGNGYGSLDDCTSYEFSLCEFCLDYLFSEFKITPKVINDGYEEKYKSAKEKVENDQWRKMKSVFFSEYNKRNKSRGKLKN